jgi:hypothetical protein
MIVANMSTIPIIRTDTEPERADADRENLSATITDRSRTASQQAAAAAGKRGLERAKSARRVARTIEHTHPKQAAKAKSTAAFVRDRAGQIRDGAAKAAAEGTKAGGREQLKGHFIEALDVDTYNAKNLLNGKKLVPRNGSTNKAYDASRIVKTAGKEKFAGAVQQKSSVHGTTKAIDQMERVKPGSASRGTLRVPKDHVAAARKRALDPATGQSRIRVNSMEFTSEQAGKQLDQGLADVAKKGIKAGSQVRALAKGGAIGAGVSVAIGAVTDARALKEGRLTRSDFVELRSVDAAEGATGAVVGTLASAAGATAATAALGTASGATFAASVGAAGTAAVGTIGGMGAGGAAVAGVLGGMTATAALPVVAGGAAAFGVGAAVTKGFKRVRGAVKDKHRRRRELEAASELPALPTALASDTPGEITLLAEITDDEHLRLP